MLPEPIAVSDVEQDNPPPSKQPKMETPAGDDKPKKAKIVKAEDSENLTRVSSRSFSFARWRHAASSSRS